MKIAQTMACLLASGLVSGCVHWNLEDCPESGILGKDVPRLRTSHYRVELASTGATAERFLSHALMSAYVYRDGEACHERDEDNPLRKDLAEELKAHLSAAGWVLVPELGLKGNCEDDRGLMFHVWNRQTGDETQVVIAFRGTSGFKDWLYGNLWWFTRAYEDNQVTRARNHAGRIIEHFKARAAANAAKTAKFIATGHSLGGGLAQHILYAYPDDVAQAIAFSPSSVTGFVAVSEDRQRKGCECRKELETEARMMRIYESYEILSNLRIFHKLLFPPERHVQEVRFPFEATWNPIAAHNMRKLALNMNAASRNRAPGMAGLPWYTSKHPSCTERLVKKQQESCSVVVPQGALHPCPQ